MVPAPASLVQSTSSLALIVLPVYLQSSIFAIVPADRTAGLLLSRSRKRSNLTQAEVARRAGVTQSVIAAYESGRRQPTVPTLRRLVAAAGGHLALIDKAEPTIERLNPPPSMTDTGKGHEPPPGRQRPYRPMRIADLAIRITSEDDPLLWFSVAEFLTEYGFEDRSSRHTLLEERPAPSGSPRIDALLAALAEHLAIHDGAEPSAWVEEPSCFLDRFWFPTNTAAARADAMVQAPASFVRRGIFIERTSLIRV